MKRLPSFTTAFHIVLNLDSANRPRTEGGKPIAARAELRCVEHEIGEADTTQVLGGQKPEEMQNPDQVTHSGAWSAATTVTGTTARTAPPSSTISTLHWPSERPAAIVW